ncbi:hypothetical protein [Nocardioides convexus]|uniref:hypothetical protein n=1 Tax=Nocardioides convexus TaxID=2712224 RepID=UPI0024189018|nr:hypothetical protein [Nocardioides convexus]
MAGSLHIGTNALINLANIVEGSALKGRATLSALDSLPQPAVRRDPRSRRHRRSVRQGDHPDPQCAGPGQPGPGSGPGHQRRRAR